MEIINKKITSELKATMSRYGVGEFELFKSELGWEDWMNKYSESEEGEEIIESEGKEIDKDLKELWDLVFENEL